jgi:hypothetical protein
MLDHFRAFGTATGDMSWQTTVDATYSLVSTIQTKFSPTTGLLSDFVINTNTSPAPPNGMWLESQYDGDYYYNSCRTPWRLTTDYIASGDTRARDAVRLINSWVTGTMGAAPGGDPTKIVDGYTLAGGKSGGAKGTSSAFSSPFAVAAMLSGNQAWLDALWSSRAIAEDYFADTITMYSMLVLSGNWWPPCQ